MTYFNGILLTLSHAEGNVDHAYGAMTTSKTPVMDRSTTEPDPLLLKMWH